jgi:hypothetical protein
MQKSAFPATTTKRRKFHLCYPKPLHVFTSNIRNMERCTGPTLRSGWIHVPKSFRKKTCASSLNIRSNSIKPESHYKIHSFIHQWLYSHLLGALVSLSLSLSLLQFPDLFYTGGRTSWTSDQLVARPLPTWRTTQTQNKRTHIHALNGIRAHDPSVQASKDISYLRPRGHCDRPHYNIAIGIFK